MGTADAKNHGEQKTDSTVAQARREALHSLHLLDAPPDPEFDRITHLVARLLGVPVSYISLIDEARQVFKSQVGLPEPWASRMETPLSHSFCQYVANFDAPLVIPNALEYPLVAENLAIPELGVIAYIGIPIHTPNGPAVGALCAVAHQPRQWTDEDVQTMKDLGSSVSMEIALRSILRVKEAMAVALFESSSDYMAVLDPEGSLLSINRAGLRLLEIENFEQCRNTEWASLWKGETAVSAHWAVEMASHGHEGRFQALSLTKKGEPKHWDVLISPVTDAAGRIVKLVAISRDITDAKQTEKVLREAARSRDEFLAMLAHELRNPLGAISAAIRIWDTGVPDDHTMQWVRKVVGRQSAQLTRIANDLLDASRLICGKILLRMQPVDLTRVLEETAEKTRPAVEQKGHAFETNIAPGLRVNGDPARLRQVVLTLINNATKYTPDGGRIALTADRDGDDAVIINLRDNGQGFTREELRRLFDLFAQGEVSLDRSKGGLGIGLTLVKKLVELHSGSVSAKSDGIGKGAEFAVHLPLLKENPYPVHASNDPQPARPPPRRVLIVDDNVDITKGVERLLRRKGYETQLAHDGLMALDVAANFHPDAVLLDIGLPKLDGYEVVRRLRSGSCGESLIIAISGYGQESDRVRAREAGFDDYLVKPVNLDSLSEMFARQR